MGRMECLYKTLIIQETASSGVAAQLRRPGSGRLYVDDDKEDEGHVEDGQGRNETDDGAFDRAKHSPHALR